MLCVHCHALCTKDNIQVNPRSEQSPLKLLRTFVSMILDHANVTCTAPHSVFRDCSTTTMMQLYKTLVRIKLENCCPVWSPTKIEDIKAIESLQRTFTSKISGLQFKTRICASLGSRMKFKTLCYPVFGRNKSTALPSF